MITIYTITFNEELIMPFFINHYRLRFPNCNIVVYDNKSIDNTVKIAKDNSCEIRPYDSGGVQDEPLLIHTKNNCWKDATTDWVLVCDTDELLDITEQELIYEESLGTTKIVSESWQMVNLEDEFDFHNIEHGWRELHQDVFCLAYDKHLLFNKKYVQDINYAPGCHSNNAYGTIKNSSKFYPLLHYKYLSPSIFVKKQRVNRTRQSEMQKQNGWGCSCLRPDDSQLQEYHYAMTHSTKILFDGKFRKP